MRLLAVTALVATSGGLAFESWKATEDYFQMQAKVDSNKTELAALEGQDQIAHRRLAQLRGDSAHESLLIDHGYLKPGYRILLFPSTPEEQRLQEAPENDVVPQRADDEDGSSWLHRVGHKLKGMFAPTPSAGEGNREEPVRAQGDDLNSTANQSTAPAASNSGAIDANRDVNSDADGLEKRTNQTSSESISHGNAPTAEAGGQVREAGSPREAGSARDGESAGNAVNSEVSPSGKSPDQPSTPSARTLRSAPASELRVE